MPDSIKPIDRVAALVFDKVLVEDPGQVDPLPEEALWRRLHAPALEEAMDFAVAERSQGAVAILAEYLPAGLWKVLLGQMVHQRFFLPPDLRAVSRAMATACFWG